MNTIKLANMQEAIHNSLVATFKKHDLSPNHKYKHFQDKFESDYNCKVVKSYSQTDTISSTIADIRYWHALRFNNSHDITMFVLKWT